MANHDSAKDHVCCGCGMSRRDFMAAAGVSAAALQLGAIDMVGAAAAAENTEPARKPLVRVAFLRPNVDHYWNTWPGTDYDPKAHQAEYTKLLTEAAEKFGVQLEIEPTPVLLGPLMGRAGPEGQAGPARWRDPGA